MLMEAKAGVSAPAANGGGKVAPEAEGEGAPAAADGIDPRLRAPERQFALVRNTVRGWDAALDFPSSGNAHKSSLLLQPNFKPGAATWNTDDPEQQPWLKNKKPKHGGKKEPAAAAAGPTASAPMPTPYMTSARVTQSVHTTGNVPILPMLRKGQNLNSYMD